MTKQRTNLALAPRAGLPLVSIINGLDWQTAAPGNFDLQRFSGALATHTVLRNRKTVAAS
jgi:hypothetical protein